MYDFSLSMDEATTICTALDALIQNLERWINEPDPNNPYDSEYPELLASARQAKENMERQLNQFGCHWD